MPELLMSEEFAGAFDSFDRPLQSQVLRRLELFVADPTHPSLQVHRIEAHANKWEFYVNKGYRVIYERLGDVIRLWRLGPHSIIDKVQYATFSAHTAFRRVDMEESTAAEPLADEPVAAAYAGAWQPQAGEGTPNRFRDLPAAHLRILGVPGALIKAIQRAPSAEEALSVPGLPPQSIKWLLDLLTDSDLERVVFDEGRLLYRTTLDRLEGYCEGAIRQLMLNLTADQQQHVSAPRAGTTLLRGVAGSGKTTVGLYRAIARAEAGRRVLMLTYSKTLNAVTRSLVESLIGPLPANLTVVNIDKWVADFLAGEGVALSPLDEVECLPLLNAALDEARQHGNEAVLGQRVDFFRDEIARVIKGGSLTTLAQYLAVPRYGRRTALAPEQRRAVWRVYEGYQQRLRAAGRCDWRDPVRIAYDGLVESPLAAPYDDLIVDEGQDLTAAQLRLVQRLIKGRDWQEGRTLLILGDAAQTIYARGFSWRQAGIAAQGNTTTLRVNHRNTRQIAESAAHLLARNRFLRAGEDFVAPEATSRMGPPPLIIDCDMAGRAVREGLLPVRPSARLDAEERELEIERQRTLLYVAMTRAAEALFLVTTSGSESLFLTELTGSIRREPFAGS